jgi:hypothetical protein
MKDGNLIYSYFMKDGMIKLDPKGDYMSAGVCYFKRNESTFPYCGTLDGGSSSSLYEGYGL